MSKAISVGSQVVFNGFAGKDLPDYSELLTKGDTYTVTEVNSDPDKPEVMEAYLVGPFTVDNEAYDAKKRKSAKNQPTKEVHVDIFADECTLVAPKTTRTKAKAKPAPVVEEQEEEQEEDTTIDFAVAAKGTIVSVEDTDGEVCEGEIIKKTKTQMTILMGDEEITYKKAEIAAIYPVQAEADDQGDQEQEEEEEQAPPPPAKKTRAKATAKKATVKKKAATRTKAKTAAKATKAKDAKEEVDPDLKKITVLSPEEDDEEILDLIEQAGDICELAVDLAEDAATVDYKLAGVLYHVYVDKAYKALNDGEYDVEKGFALYAEKELGTGYRKAMYLIRGYGAWNKLGLSSEDFTRLGWTKAVEVAEAGTVDNIDALMEVAQESSVTELKETIKESFTKEGKDTREVIKKVTYKFRLVEEAANIVTQYLELAAKQLGEKDDGKVFETIVSEWAMEHLDVSKVTRAKKTTAKRAASTRKKTTATAAARA